MLRKYPYLFLILPLLVTIGIGAAILNDGRMPDKPFKAISVVATAWIVGITVVSHFVIQRRMFTKIATDWGLVLTNNDYKGLVEDVQISLQYDETSGGKKELNANGTVTVQKARALIRGEFVSSDAIKGITIQGARNRAPQGLSQVQTNHPEFDKHYKCFVESNDKSLIDSIKNIELLDYLIECREVGCAIRYNDGYVTVSMSLIDDGPKRVPLMIDAVLRAGHSVSTWLAKKS